MALKQFLAAKKIKAPNTGSTEVDRKAQILLSLISLRPILVIRSPSAPAAPETNILNQFLELLKNHFRTAHNSKSRRKINEARQQVSEIA